MTVYHMNKIFNKLCTKVALKMKNMGVADRLAAKHKLFPFQVSIRSFVLI